MSNFQSTPTAETGTEYINDRVMIIEKQQVGPTEFTVALSGHSRENASKIIAALAKCDTIAIEAPGMANNEEHRKQLEESLSRLMSSELPNGNTPEDVRHYFNQQDNESAGFFVALAGSNKQMRLLDINKESPNFVLSQQSMTARKEFATAVANALPPSHVRQTLLESASIVAKSDTARDAVLSQQLAAMGYDANEPRRIGVILGATHYHALESIGSSTEQLGQLVRQNVTPFDTLVLDLKDRRQPTEETINKTLLKAYIAELGGNIAKSMKVISTLDDTVVKRCLKQIETITSQNIDAYQKAMEIAGYNEAVISLL